MLVRLDHGVSPGVVTWGTIVTRAMEKADQSFGKPLLRRQPATIGKPHDTGIPHATPAVSRTLTRVKVLSVQASGRPC